MRVRAAIAGLTIAALFCVPGFSYDTCSVPDMGFTDDDRSRLENLDTSRVRGLGAAMVAENADDRAIVSDLFSPGLAPVDPELLIGKYQCRTIKMGGGLPLVVYQWFSCEIGQEEGTYTVRKITGSQNFFGVLEPAGAGYAYKGAQHYGYEDQIRLYGDDPAHNQTGCLSAVTKGNNHFILELPFPRVESFHDIIEFKR